MTLPLNATISNFCFFFFLFHLKGWEKKFLLKCLGWEILKVQVIIKVYESRGAFKRGVGREKKCGNRTFLNKIRGWRGKKKRVNRYK